MPFAMTHLYIAYNILSNTSKIKKPCDFMLGAIAPDSVHFRDNYNSDMKKKSHLCIGDEKWGRLTNNDEWLKNVLHFLERNKNKENADFIYGYCSHIIADIQNNIKIWTPFLVENREALDKGLGSFYHEESYNIDYELYIGDPRRKEIWEMLERAVAYDISDVVVGEEINKMKDSVLHSQFLNREHKDGSLYKYVTVPIIQDFISSESLYIKSLLFKND